MTLFQRLHYNVVLSTIPRRRFSTLLRRHNMVERFRDVKTTVIQRRYDVMYLLGIQRKADYPRAMYDFEISQQMFVQHY